MFPAKLIAIAKKEFKHLLRDKRLLFVVFFFPVLLLAVFGYAINFDVKHVKIAVLDRDHSRESREFVRKLSATAYFDVVSFLDSERQIDYVINSKEAQTVLTIPQGFGESLHRTDKKAVLQFVVDGVDGNTATIIINYERLFSARYSDELNASFLSRRGVPLDIETRFLFNPNLESSKFLLPGLIAMILIVTAMVTVSLSLVREKELGTEEQLRVSSISSFELITGKALPYVTVSMINAALVLFAGYLLFGIVVKGSWLLLTLSMLVFVTASISMGIFVSVIADSQQLAFQLSSLISLLPSVILSGFVFPIESMPRIIQYFAYLTPTTFFIKVLRGIILKGVGLEAFGMELIYLLVFPFFFFGISSLISMRKARNS
jgi:ABC-2 type transport system permease protein